MLSIHVLLRSCYCHKLFKICNKNERFFTALEKVDYDMKHQLDVISIFRRLRMHGFALHQVMSRFDRRQVGIMARKKHINMVRKDEEPNDNLWARFEHLSMREKFQL